MLCLLVLLLLIFSNKWNKFTYARTCMTFGQFKQPYSIKESNRKRYIFALFPGAFISVSRSILCYTMLVSPQNGLFSPSVWFGSVRQAFCAVLSVEQYERVCVVMKWDVTIYCWFSFTTSFDTKCTHTHARTGKLYTPTAFPYNIENEWCDLHCLDTAFS